MKKEHVVVTGGAGFIGSNITHALVAANYKVTVIDNLATGKLANIADIRRRIRFIHGDIRNQKLLLRLFKDVDFVLHQAALNSIPRSINSPVDTHDVNVNGTFRILMAARERKVKKIVFASSSSIYGNRKVYGRATVSNKKEAMKPMPLAPYPVTKLIGEEYCKVFAHIFKVPSVCLRYFNVFGHHQNPHSPYSAVIPKFIIALLAGQRPTIFGDGHQARDFTYVDNVVKANILAMHAPRVVMGETINVACGESIPLLYVYRSIAKHLHRKIRPKFGPSRTGDLKNSLADISKAKRLIGYTPIVHFDEGLRRTVDWYLSGAAGS